MSISRRTALKQFLVLAGGAALIPACMQADGGAASINLKHLTINASDEQLLADMAETFLPATDTPGGKDLYLHHFALTMLDDCHSPEEHKAFEKGLDAFKDFTKKNGGAFSTLTAQQRTALLEQLEDRKDEDELQHFYKKTKNLMIHGYLTSKHYLTKVRVYELVPGRYRGCMPVGGGKKAA